MVIYNLVYDSCILLLFWIISIGLLHAVVSGYAYFLKRSTKHFRIAVLEMDILLCTRPQQGGHIPGILRDFSEHGKLMEFSGNSVQPQGKLTLCSGCSLCQAVHMQPSVSGARKLIISAIWDDRLLLVT